MPRAKATTSSLSEMIESPAGSGDAEAPPEDSNQENHTPPKRGRGKGKATSTRKVKPASKRLSGGKTRTTATRVAKRAPLKDKANTRGRKQLEEVVEQEEDAGNTLEEEDGDGHIQPEAPEPTKAKRKGRPRKAKDNTATAPPSIPSKTTVGDDDFEYTPSTARNARKPQDAIPADTVTSTNIIPEAEMDLDNPSEDNLAELPESVTRQQPRARSSSQRPQQTNPRARHHAETTSDQERLGEPDLRRKLGDMTKKFEGLDTKYRNLREIGVKDAEANFDKLKQQSEERNKITGELIAKLRQELGTANQKASEADAHRRDIQAAQAALENSECRVAELIEALDGSQKEVRALQARIAATRVAGTTVETASALGRIQGSTADGKGPVARNAMAGSAEAAKAAQMAQLKEIMYTDLTGLIMRTVDRQEDADVFDCIQTGRNGALHFKLFVPVDANSPYDETEIQYIPRLEDNRDRDLIEILPEYLREEISFSNANAAKFYSRVVDTLTRKPADE